VAIDPAKIHLTAQWPTPSCVKKLRSFLGLDGYYQKFIHHFGIICQPLHALLRKGALFLWAEDHSTAFQTLKQALMLAPVLALPDFSTQFTIETDASSIGVGVVLMQKGHPLAFLSKALGPKSCGLSAYEKEFMAILVAVQQWCKYLQNGEFMILTDHQSLSQLNEQRLHTPWQHKVFTKLLGLQYKIVYQQGHTNRVAAALSRRLEPKFNVVSEVIPHG
jgi:hypothetical protein